MERLSPYVLLKQGQDQAAQTHSLPDPRDARKVGVE
jgi:hypothetical protein